MINFIWILLVIILSPVILVAGFIVLAIISFIIFTPIALIINWISDW